MGVLHRYSWLSHGFIPHGFVQTYPRQRRRTPARTCKRLYTSERALSKSSLVKFIHTSTRLVFHCNWEYVSHGVALPDSWSHPAERDTNGSFWSYYFDGQTLSFPLCVLHFLHSCLCVLLYVFKISWCHCEQLQGVTYDNQYKSEPINGASSFQSPHYKNSLFLLALCKCQQSLVFSLILILLV